MVDIIFEQPNIPYLITRKFCNGLFTIVQKKKIWCAIMGTILKDDFEIKPLLEKILPRVAKNTAGSKIKTL
jgi:hypothetical protein